MTQIFIFGSSNAYGAGGPNGGWADKLKLYFHQQMYSASGAGEKHEIFNFAKSGAPIQFVQETFPDQLKFYGKDGRKIALLSVGVNNAKAENSPDNFVSSIEEYTALMTKLLQELQADFNQVIVVGYRPHDETKTAPKENPLTGGRSYFWNERTGKFNTALQNICAENRIKLVEFDIDPDYWIQNYLCDDGLHPNDAGYQIMFEAIKSYIIL